jgi:hypothetical protein
MEHGLTCKPTCRSESTKTLPAIEDKPTITAKAQPSKALISPTNHALILIDFQPQMAFATKSIDGVNLRNNAALTSKAAAEFKVPTIVTTIAEKSFSGPTFDEIKKEFPDQNVIDRTSMNGWDRTGHQLADIRCREDTFSGPHRISANRRRRGRLSTFRAQRISRRGNDAHLLCQHENTPQ